jgi:hypothetical protein
MPSGQSHLLQATALPKNIMNDPDSKYEYICNALEHTSLKPIWFKNRAEDQESSERIANGAKNISPNQFE